ncbi:adenine(58)-N(1)-methyltransferase non-catalytic subunit TRM6, partial [Ochromonadaceae sp. CCMP2298]
MEDDGLIREGDTLVLRSFDDKSSYILQVNGGEKKINRTRVSLKGIVGQPYGAVFELSNRKFFRISESEEWETELFDAGGDEEGEEPSTSASGEAVGAVGEGAAVAAGGGAVIAGAGALVGGAGAGAVAGSGSGTGAVAVTELRGDNSGYVDTNTAQRLTNEDIAKLKDGGSSAQQIIKTLIENSDTFAGKTDFAQAKWIKRKEMKYRRRYKIQRSCPVSICEASFCKNREKIANMRPDSLAQILSQSGVHAGSRVLVLDSLTGMLVGSLAYRMRGSGQILALYGSQQPHLEMASSFNLDKASLDIIQPVPSLELGPAARDVCK